MQGVSIQRIHSSFHLQHVKSKGGSGMGSKGRGGVLEGEGLVNKNKSNWPSAFRVGTSA